MANSSSTSTAKPGRALTIAGAVCAVMSLVIVPIVFGPVGAILAFVGYAKGDKPLGMYVGIAAIVLTIIGLVLTAIVLHANSH